MGAVRSDTEPRTGVVEHLRAHDAEHATDHAATLLAYLRQCGDVAAASGEWHIHQTSTASPATPIAAQSSGRPLTPVTPQAAVRSTTESFPMSDRTQAGRTLLRD